MIKTIYIKQKPRYFSDLAKRSEANLILIAVDLIALKTIRRLHGVCLFCDKEAYDYDLTFCFQREIWILYAHKSKAKLAWPLARAVQLSGAHRILVMLLSASLCQGGNYGKH